ncbi:MAG: hypothetical protein HZC22_04550 [Rhodocyclales bacterium]|nr:hypothetical protein [Rhodocyclales bacterium]
MRRFTPIDNTPSLDEDIRALMEDIDASMADFEKRLDAERMRQPRPTATSAPAAAIPLPRVAQPPGGSVPPAPAEAPPPEAPPVAAPPAAQAPTQDGGGGLLAELAAEASARTGDAVSRRAIQQRRIHDALDRVYRFFEAFNRHANALAPTIGRSYRLDTQAAYTDLRWHEAMVKSRKDSLSELALLDFVAFRVRLVAPGPVTVAVGWSRLDAFKKDMHILDLRSAEGMDLDGVVEGGELVMHLAPDFPVQITFGANHESGRIDVLSRNLEGFGIAAFTCMPDDVTQEFLDALGRFLLARSNNLPAALRRAHCRAEL